MHHLQHTSSTLSGILDFKSALVLMVLVRNSNQFGVINQCGIHKIKHKTGLSKDAIFRCIKTLENQGVIRTRVDGVLSSKIIRVSNPFYMLVPDWGLYPMIGLATAAAVIASQAVITGVFSMTNQAIQLRYLPRLTVHHTSDVEQGQIYLPFINWVLFISVVILILLFENSANLASAYGVAVTMTMLFVPRLWFLALASVESFALYDPILVH